MHSGEMSHYPDNLIPSKRYNYDKIDKYGLPKKCVFLEQDDIVISKYMKGKDEHGADALRWFMLVSGSPWQARRVGHGTIAEVVRKTLLTYWNTVAFQSLYARASSWDSDTASLTDLTDLDNWAVSQATRLARDVDLALENFDTQRAGRFIAEYVDDLSNWYVRRSRRRFWDGDHAALSTLHHCLKVVTQVMAPFTPFITERVWQDLYVTPETPSVHISAWPTWSDDEISDTLRDQVDLTRRLVELGRSARATSGVKTRQPLQRALVAAAGWDSLPEGLQAQIRDEVNVLSLESLSGTDELVDVTLKANFKTLGARFGKGTPAIAAAISAADAKNLVAELKSGKAFVVVANETFEIGPDDVVVTEVPREGWTVASDSGESLALDLALTPELIGQGIARDVTRLIQDARKSSGFDISDRISVIWESANDITVHALLTHHELISAEVLATSWQQGQVAVATAVDEELELKVLIVKA